MSTSPFPWIVSSSWEGFMRCQGMQWGRGSGGSEESGPQGHSTKYTGSYWDILYPGCMTPSGSEAPSISLASSWAQGDMLYVSLGHGKICCLKPIQQQPTMHPLLLWGLATFLGLYWVCKEHIFSIPRPHTNIWDCAIFPWWACRVAHRT